MLLLTPQELQDELRKTIKYRRKCMRITQAELAIKTQIPLGTLRKFEQTGAGSLANLIRIIVVLDLTTEWSSFLKNINSMKKKGNLVMSYSP